jgi:hypothetical protein
MDAQILYLFTWCVVPRGPGRASLGNVRSGMSRYHQYRIRPLSHLAAWSIWFVLSVRYFARNVSHWKNGKKSINKPSEFCQATINVTRLIWIPRVKSRTFRFYPGFYPLHLQLRHIFTNMRFNALWLSIILKWAHKINAIYKSVLYCTD